MKDTTSEYHRTKINILSKDSLRKLLSLNVAVYSEEEFCCILICFIFARSLLSTSFGTLLHTLISCAENSLILHDNLHWLLYLLFHFSDQQEFHSNHTKYVFI